MRAPEGWTGPLALRPPGLWLGDLGLALPLVLCCNLSVNRTPEGLQTGPSDIWPQMYFIRPAKCFRKQGISFKKKIRSV